MIPIVAPVYEYVDYKYLIKNNDELLLTLVPRNLEHYDLRSIYESVHYITRGGKIAIADVQALQWDRYQQSVTDEFGDINGDNVCQFVSREANIAIWVCEVQDTGRLRISKRYGSTSGDTHVAFLFRHSGDWYGPLYMLIPGMPLEMFLLYIDNANVVRRMIENHELTLTSQPIDKDHPNFAVSNRFQILDGETGIPSTQPRYPSLLAREIYNLGDYVVYKHTVTGDAGTSLTANLQMVLQNGSSIFTYPDSMAVFIQGVMSLDNPYLSIATGLEMGFAIIDLTSHSISRYDDLTPPPRYCFILFQSGADNKYLFETAVVKYSTVSDRQLFPYSYVMPYETYERILTEIQTQYLNSQSPATQFDGGLQDGFDGEERADGPHDANQATRTSDARASRRVSPPPGGIAAGVAAPAATATGQVRQTIRRASPRPSADGLPQTRPGNDPSPQIIPSTEQASQGVRRVASAPSADRPPQIRPGTIPPRPPEATLSLAHELNLIRKVGNRAKGSRNPHDTIMGLRTYLEEVPKTIKRSRRTDGIILLNGALVFAHALGIFLLEVSPRDTKEILLRLENHDETHTHREQILEGDTIEDMTRKRRLNHIRRISALLREAKMGGSDDLKPIIAAMKSSSESCCCVGFAKRNESVVAVTLVVLSPSHSDDIVDLNDREYDTMIRIVGAFVSGNLTDESKTQPLIIASLVVAMALTLGKGGRSVVSAPSGFYSTWASDRSEEAHEKLLSTVLTKANFVQEIVGDDIVIMKLVSNQQERD
ncbi:hypothetical protein HDU93_009613, partial [Gonapodya sp. JEL0774]